MEGTEEVVHVVGDSCQKINFGYVDFRIWKDKVSLKRGTRLHAQGFFRKSQTQIDMP